MKKLSLALTIMLALAFIGCKKKNVPTSVNYNGTTLHFTSGKIGSPTKWSESNSVTGATSETDGKANTETIVAAIGAGDYPAKRCADLVEGGFDDWYLPSVKEFQAISALGDDLPGDYTGMYWTSTERGFNTADYGHIHYGSQYNNNKGYTYNCLCVRKD